MTLRALSQALFALILAGVLSACVSNGGGSAAGPTEYYEVHRDGRIYVFADRFTFDQFQVEGETPFRVTRIAEGPQGETLVFAISEEDRIKTRGLPAPDLYDGKRKPSALYAEVHKDGQIYLTDSMDSVVRLRNGEAVETAQQHAITGPEGETVLLINSGGNGNLLEVFQRYQ